MACVGCQQRREAIARLAAKVGTVVFGGRKRQLGNFSDDDGKKGGSPGLDQSATVAGVVAGIAAGPDSHAGAAGAGSDGTGTTGGAG